MTGPRVALGTAYLRDNHWRFLVWAPRVKCMAMVLLQARGLQVLFLARRESTYHEAAAGGVEGLVGSV